MGQSSRYLQLRNSAFEKGLSLLTRGRLKEGVTPSRSIVARMVAHFIGLQRRDLMEIVEERYGRRLTIVTSQLPVETWHHVIGEPTFADAILDRLVHNAYRISLDGPSPAQDRHRQPPRGQPMSMTTSTPGCPVVPPMDNAPHQRHPLTGCTQINDEDFASDRYRRPVR